MNLLKEKLIPFDGLGEIKLLSSFEYVKNILKMEKINFSIAYQPNKGCNPEVPWTIIYVENSISLTFAKEKLWRITCKEKFVGSLENGIKLGMPLKEALKIDTSLIFDDWNEVYESREGYWLEDNLDNNTVLSFTIFIKEALDDDVFFKYDW